MKLKLLDINEVTLETKDKLCKENISLVVDNTNITPENIKFGVSILGVRGTLQSGGGGGEDEDEPSGTVAVETCSILIQRGVPDGPGVSVYYLDESLQLQHITATTTTRIACVKNSIVVVSGAMMGEFSGDITQIGARAGFLIAAATGDGTIIFGE